MFVTSWFMPAGWRPLCKRNSALNRSLGTLQLSCSFCYCVIPCAVQMCCGAACERRKFPPVPVSITVRVVPKSGGTCSQHCATHCVYIMHKKTAHKLGYLYMYWRVILCGSLFVVTVFVWAKLNVEVCLFVFLVCLVAQ